jgi:hypothetical protein
MEWLGPESKSGRKTAYVAGQNDNKMLVKVGRFLPTVSLELDASKKRKESRHTIAEAGLKNMIERFCNRWQEEKKLGLTKVVIQEGGFSLAVGNTEITRPCICVTTLHDPKERHHYRFYRTKLYFDTESGIPIRMEGFDWPTSAADEGQLMEHYAYLDLRLDVGLKDEDFKW